MRSTYLRIRTGLMSELGQEATFGEALLYISELIANCAARHLAARGGIASKISGGRPSSAYHCPGGPCSTSFVCDVQPTGPGIQ